MTAKSIMDKLVKYGCKRQHNLLFQDQVTFDPMEYTPLTVNLAMLIRAIRDAVNAAHTPNREYLVADIDRMGRVIGWHVPKRKNR